METAAISDVTPAMMDEAARGAAEAAEAAAHPSEIQAAPVDGEPSGEPAPHPMEDPAVFAPTENQTVSTVSFEEEAAEAMPISAPSPVETIATSAPFETAAASIDAEVATMGEASASVAVSMPPPVAFPTLTTEAERNDETMRGDLSSPGDAIGAYGAQVVEMLAANLAASSYFLTALMGATSVTDVMAVNTNHLRRQMELLTTQGRQLTMLARTIAFDAIKPFGALPTNHGRDR